MLSLYLHLTYLFFASFSFLTCSVLTLACLASEQSVFLSISAVSFGGYSLKLSFLLDYMSLSFMSIVLLISSVILVYSYNYIAPYSKPSLFIILTLLFVFSMLLVISMSSLFFLMLGWDGLGLISFLLIVYYQSQSSITSGIFTLLMNRIGDCFFLLTIAAFLCFSVNTSFSFSPLNSAQWVSALLMITFITNSALFPFSSWLPLAIAAPTPISALVHSSTLVTAGLYLMMRFSVFFYTFPFLMSILVVVSLFTSFYAGINAVFETDLNKLIALSTLSHLGFIGLAFSSGFISLAFFHLLTHALFKSLLFMVMGDIMTNLSHSQDIRCLSSGVLLTPGSSVLMSLSLANLLGLPSLSGFFSNDLILESLHFSSLSVALLVILLLNVCFTYFYTLQLFYFMFQSSNSFSFSLLHSPKSLLHSPLLALLGFLGLPFSAFFFIAVTHSALFVPVPLLLKSFPIVSISVMLILLFVNSTQFSATSPSPFFFFSNMAGLSLVFLPIASSTYYTVVMSSVRSFEQGLGGHVLNDVPSLIIQTMSSVVYSLSASTSLNSCLLFIPLFVALATVVSV